MSEQIQYAALDAYASLTIYNALLNIPTPSALPDSPKIGTPVLLFNNDSTQVLAHGTISPHALEDTFMGIHLSSSRSVVEIHQVFVPGALISNGTSNRQPLDKFGPPPFHIPCLWSHLCHSIAEFDDVMLANSAGDTNQDPQPMTMGDLRTEQGSRSDSELDPSDILPELCGPPSTILKSEIYC